MMTPGQRCDEIIRLVEEALDGGPTPFARPVPAATTSAAPMPAVAGIYYGRR